MSVVNQHVGVIWSICVEIIMLILYKISNIATQQCSVVDFVMSFENIVTVLE